MFQIERHQKISQIIKKRKSIDVSWLSQELGVSEVTVRRDLEKLEKQGVLIRTYGGAILNPDYEQTSDVEEIEAASQNFSKIAMELGELSDSIVDVHDILFLGKCESNYVLADLLQDKTDVIVFTNSLDILSIMTENKTGTVLVTGGQVDYNYRTIVNNSIVPFPNITVDKAFLRVDAVHMSYGIFVNEHTDATIYKEVKKIAKNLVLIMENHVFNKVGLIKVDELDGMDYVIADKNMPDNYKKTFFNNGVQLHQKFELN